MFLIVAFHCIKNFGFRDFLLILLVSFMDKFTHKLNMHLCNSETRRKTLYTVCQVLMALMRNQTKKGNRLISREIACPTNHLKSP